MRKPIPTPPHIDVWEEFEQDFIQDWDDMNAHYKATAELDKLKMEGSNIDHYITKFAKLARKVQYYEDDCYGFLYPYDMLSQLGTWVCIWLLPHAIEEPCYLTCFRLVIE